MEPCIVGWAHTRFGKLEGEDVESLIRKVTQEALDNAGVCAADIDAIYLGHYNNGLSPQDFTSSLVLQADAGFRFKPVTRVENACATGSAAVYQGINCVRAGRGRLVLVIGVEKMTNLPAQEVGNVLQRACYVKEESGTAAGFTGIFARIAQEYFERHGDQSDALARIAAKNHKNGASNPLAHMQKDLGYDFCRNVSEKNPMVATPLKRTDCSMISDGAAALVLADSETALTMKKAVTFRAASHVSDFLPMSLRDMSWLQGSHVAWQNAYAEAGISLEDLDFVETHDCYTVAELMEYEAMGLTQRGDGSRAILEGWTEMNGKLPVNPSGGLKAKGHPIGATGVSMHVMAAMQVTASAPTGIQVKDASIAGVFNMGGAAVAHYVSILEAVR